MSVIQAIGSLVGLVMGGPQGAALGSGLGTLIGGGSFGDALKSGITSFGIGSLPGGQAMLAQNALGNVFGGGGGGMGFFGGEGAGMDQGRGQTNPLAALFGGGAGMQGAQRGMNQPPKQGSQTQQQGGIGPFLSGLAQSPLVMAGLLEAVQPRGSMMSPQQERQMATGERLPDYRGTAAPDFRYGGGNPQLPGYAMGGYIQGPGTGTSDSIPAMIYQNGGPVQEARLSDGEFVMTERAVRGAGGGDRGKGAAKMYEMMSRLERRA